MSSTAAATDQEKKKKIVAIVGAGPIGLAAALGCLRRGYEPIVFEKEKPGASLARFGPTRFFSPLSMNLTKEMLALLPSSDAVPEASALLTGPEIAALLGKIARSATLAKHVKCKHEVRRVTRDRLSRGDHAGHPVRGELTFRVVVADLEAHHDDESAVHADAVLDASGTYGQPVPIAVPGGDVLASRWRSASRSTIVIRHLGDLHERRGELANKRVLLVGHGHSAANALLMLDALAREAPSTHVTWALRSRNLRPCETVPGDPLPERERVVTGANVLAAAKPPSSWLRVERAAFIESFRLVNEGAAIEATMAGNRTATVDAVVALTGYRPDLAPLSELPIEISPATEGAMRLRRALANVTDCLSVPTLKLDDLASGEPRFHLIGTKSYGRARTFLLQSGYAQLETILDHLFAA